MIHKYTGTEDLPEPGRWTVHGRRPIYESRWVSLTLIDVEPINGERYEHHVVGVPYEAVSVVVHHLQRGVLLLYRHRFITDTAGFELPAGGVDRHESIEAAAAREVLEETGWAVSTPEVFLSANASDGLSDQRFHFAYAEAVGRVGDPEDAYEADRLYWVPVDQLPTIIGAGRVPGCPSMLGLLYAQAFGYLELSQ
jgi:8-oxo-dGTP pyrophosphatase MutT (NUDIX family)